MTNYFFSLCNKSCYISGVILISLLWGGMSCNKNETPTPTPPIKTTDISVVNGSTFTIDLDVQSSTGSTGLTWVMTALPSNSIATLVSEEEIENSDKSKNWGIKRFRLSALKTGTLNLEFKMTRPTVLTEVYEISKYNVAIK